MKYRDKSFSLREKALTVRGIRIPARQAFVGFWALSLRMFFKNEAFLQGIHSIDQNIGEWCEICQRTDSGKHADGIARSCRARHLQIGDRIANDHHIEWIDIYALADCRYHIWRGLGF